MIRTALKYGLICGVFLTGIFHLSFYFGSNPMVHVEHLIFDLLIMGLFIFFADKEFKTYVNNGILHFWQGMTVGFVVYGTAAVLFAVGIFIYLKISPEAVISYREEATKLLEQGRERIVETFGEAGYQSQLDKIKSMSADNMVFRTFFQKLLPGFLITPVISVILRKQTK